MPVSQWHVTECRVSLHKKSQNGPTADVDAFNFCSSSWAQASSLDFVRKQIEVNNKRSNALNLSQEAF